MPRDLFLPHSATSYLSLVFCRSFLKYLGTWLRYRVEWVLIPGRSLDFCLRTRPDCPSASPIPLCYGSAELLARLSGRSMELITHSRLVRVEKCVDLRLKFSYASPLRVLSKKLCIFTFTSCALDVAWCCHNCICDLHRRVVRNILVLSYLSSVLSIVGELLRFDREEALQCYLIFSQEVKKVCFIYSCVN